MQSKLDILTLLQQEYHYLDSIDREIAEYDIEIVRSEAWIEALEWVLKENTMTSTKLSSILKGASDATIKAAQQRIHNEMGNLPED
jgi:hypothetical protein